MKQIATTFARYKSIIVSTILSAACLLPTAASAEILAYKQLQNMFQQGESWHLQFVEWLANTGSAAEENVQLKVDLRPLGAGQTVTIISAEPIIQIEATGAVGNGVAQINPEFNGDTEENLLLSGATLGAGEILRVTYAVDVVLAEGPIAVQSVASPGDDLSANGEKNLNRSDDFDNATLISLPRTVGPSSDSCPAGLIESSFNLVKNGSFATVHGIKPSSNAPLNITSNANQLIAGSFFSDAPYAGDDTFAADNNVNGAFGFDPVNGISIQQSNAGAGITLFSGSTFQHGFPGDADRNVPASSNFLLYNGNTSSATVGVWMQKVAGVMADEKYHFVVYTSNAEWPGNPEQSTPRIQLLASGADIEDSPVLSIRQEKANEQDIWSPISTVLSPVGTEIELSIRDNTSGTTLGDHLALAQIGLFKCLEPAADDDGDGLTNAAEKALGTNPDNKDTDGDGVDDNVEVNNSPQDGDGDGIIDALESATADSDGDGEFDQFDSTNDGPTGDADGDGVTNGDEKSEGSNPNNSDTDGDGKLDGVEFGKDSDNDGKFDSIESSILDEDGDGLFDEFDNFDNRPKSSGGGASGLLIILFPVFAALRRRQLKSVKAV